MTITFKPQRRITAKSLILDLLRASEPNTWPVSSLIEVAEIFGVSDNAIRVNISRLTAKMLIEADERGSYRLASQAHSMKDWIDSWVEGEGRVRDWAGDWLSVVISPSLSAQKSAVLEKALQRLGFRLLWKKYWIRPDNLAAVHEEVGEQLAAMAETAQFLFSRTSQLLQPNNCPSLHTLWDVDGIEARYKQYIALIDERLQRPHNENIEEIIYDTFTIGGDTIYLLLIDPLLPEDFIDVTLRARLTASMRAYDTTFRPYWQQRYMQIDELHCVPGGLDQHLHNRLSA